MSHGVSRVNRKAMIFIISASQTAFFASRFHFKKACWVGLGLENRVMQPMSNIQPPSWLQVLQFKNQCFYYIVYRFSLVQDRQKIQSNVLRLDFDLRSISNLSNFRYVHLRTSLRSSLLQNWNTFFMKLLNGQLKVWQGLLSTEGRPNKHIIRTQPSAKGICRMRF